MSFVDGIDEELTELRREREAMLYELGQINNAISVLELQRCRVLSGEKEPHEIVQERCVEASEEVIPRVLFDVVNGR